MTTDPKVTREVIENYLRCKTKSFLTRAGRRGVKGDYEKWRLAVTSRQQVDAAANLTLRYRGRTISENAVLVALNSETGPDVFLRGKFDNGFISLTLDALVKTEQATVRGKSPYVPVLFHHGEIRTEQKVLLELFALVISELQENEPTVGLVFRSEGKPTTVRFGPGLKTARNILREIRELNSGLVPPVLVLNNHCQVCEFHDRCRAQALKDDNLSLLRGIKEHQIAQLNEKGIFTVNQLSYTFKARRRPKRAKKSSVVHHFPLRALALREKKIFVHGNPVVEIAGTRVYLDIEGTPDSHMYYLIGVTTVSGQQESHSTYGQVLGASRTKHRFL